MRSINRHFTYFLTRISDVMADCSIVGSSSCKIANCECFIYVIFQVFQWDGVYVLQPKEAVQSVENDTDNTDAPSANTVEEEEVCSVWCSTF